MIKIYTGLMKSYKRNAKYKVDQFLCIIFGRRFSKKSKPEQKMLF